MKNISILLTLYRIESDSLTNPSLFHPFHFDSHICSLLLAITTNENHFYSKGKRRKKKKEKNTQSRIQPPSFDPPLPFPVSRKPKIARPFSLHSPIFPLVLSPPPGQELLGRRKSRRAGQIDRRREGRKNGEKEGERVVLFWRVESRATRK